MAANKKRLFSVWNISSILILAVFLLFILFPLVLVLKKVSSTLIREN